MQKCSLMFLTMVLFSSLTAPAMAAEKGSIQLFFTSDVYGYLKPCG